MMFEEDIKRINEHMKSMSESLKVISGELEHKSNETLDKLKVARVLAKHLPGGHVRHADACDCLTCKIFEKLFGSKNYSYLGYTDKEAEELAAKLEERKVE